MSGEIRRENFADEASWLEFQRNQSKLAKHQREREAAQKHATTGRDYSVIKRINRRIKRRKMEHRKYWRNPDKARKRNRRRAARYYERHADVQKARSQEWRAKNREWVAQQGRWYREQHRDEINAKNREYRARKRAEKLAQQQGKAS